MVNKTELQPCQIDAIKKICESFRNDPQELINVLHACQGEFGYLPEDVQREIAANLNISVARVYGVVTFYSFFTMKPKGKYSISCCMGTACYVRGAEKVVDAFKSKLGIEVGGVTADKLFSLDCLRCVGACGLAPVAMIGDKVYGHLTPDKVNEIVDSYRNQDEEGK